jgi:hypothetical protein
LDRFAGTQPEPAEEREPSRDASVLPSHLPGPAEAFLGLGALTGPDRDVREHGVQPRARFELRRLFGEPTRSRTVAAEHRRLDRGEELSLPTGPIGADPAGEFEGPRRARPPLAAGIARGVLGQLARQRGVGRRRGGEPVVERRGLVFDVGRRPPVQSGAPRRAHVAIDR